jgi:peptidylprolyl isomerase
MRQAKIGDNVKVHYTGRLMDGSVFDSSRDREPLVFSLGAGTIIPGIENGVVGMKPGEKKNIKVPPEEAFGQRREDLVAEVAKSDIPKSIEPSIGKQLILNQKDGSPINVTVTKMNEKSVTIDANHPLAGETLEFEIELTEIV